MQDNWKLIRFFAGNRDGSDRYELYDLAADPREAHDQAITEVNRLNVMKQRLATLLTETEAVIPLANPAYSPPTRSAKN